MEHPRVLVGTITCDLYAYCLNEFLHATTTIDYPNYDVLVVDNSKTDDYANLIRTHHVTVIKQPYHDNLGRRIQDSRNQLRDYALQHHYDSVLFLEQDVTPPPHALTKLLSHHKPVTAGLYFLPVDIHTNDTIVHVFAPLLGIADEYETDNQRFMNEHEIDHYLNNPQLIRVKGCGLGCTLVHTNVLKTITFTFDDHDDAQNFCRDLWQQKIPIHADTGVVCKHHLTNKPSAIHDAFNAYFSHSPPPR